MTQRLRADGVILVTGASGFIGSHLAEFLLQHGNRVRCVVRPGHRRHSWIDGLPVETVAASLTDPRSLLAASEGVRTIIHVAGVTKAKRESDFRKGNVDTTAALLDLAGRLPDLKRFTCIGSLAVVGPSRDGTPLSEDDPPNPPSAYGRSKWEAEELCRAASSTIPVTIVRPPTVYGPRDRDVLEMFRWVRYGIHPVIGAPNKTLSLVHVRDLVRGIAAATLHPLGAGKTYFVSNEQTYHYDELIALIASIVGRRPMKVRLPIPLLLAVAATVHAISYFGPRPAVLSLDKARDMAQPHWVCSSKRIEAELGVRSEISIEEGFQETYRWYRSHGWL